MEIETLETKDNSKKCDIKSNQIKSNCICIAQNPN